MGEKQLSLMEMPLHSWSLRSLCKLENCYKDWWPQHSLAHRMSSVSEGSYHFHCLTSFFSSHIKIQGDLPKRNQGRQNGNQEYSGKIRQSASKELNLFGLLLLPTFQSACVCLLHSLSISLFLAQSSITAMHKTLWHLLWGRGAPRYGHCPWTAARRKSMWWGKAGGKLKLQWESWTDFLQCNDFY